VTLGFSHVDEHGHARMVDVTAKAETTRRALARAVVVGAGDLSRFPGGSVGIFAGARAAGLLGAKQTALLIPLCHPLPLSALSVDFEAVGNDVVVSAVAETLGQTGVEMEALTACALASLALVAEVLPDSRCARIDELCLWEKSGGRSGDWVRSASGPDLLEHRG
jgi:cyclic pyranopterin monophosphate synthase